MQNFILSLEGQFPQIYSQSKTQGIATINTSTNAPNTASHSSSTSSLPSSNPTTSDEILPNKLPLKRRLAEFRFGRDGGSVSISGSKKTSVSNTTNFTTNPFAFDKFKDINVAFTVNLHEDGILIDPGSIGPLPYSHPTTLHLLNAIKTGILPAELFLTLLEQSHYQQLSLFYDGCVVVGVVEWRKGMVLTIGNNNVSNGGITRHSTGAAAVQWARRNSHATANNNNNTSVTALTPETHKVLLKPTADCWHYALNFLASLPSSSSESLKFARILEDEASLLEFERQLILINEPLVCLDPSPAVMFAMNSLHYDHFKHRLYSSNKLIKRDNLHDEFDQIMLNLAASKPSRSLVDSPVLLNTQNQTSPSSSTSSVNPRYRRINLIESWQERERRRTIEPIYGIDHRRQFVKNRQPLPPSSFVPANWRPFKTVRYEREIASTSNTGNNGTLTKVYYCVNVFYAPPPTHPPIQLFLQIGTSPDTSTSGCLHHLTFANLIETDLYLQNLRNLLLIENGNCNLKVITDISTTGNGTGTGTAGGNASAQSTQNTNTNVPSIPNINTRKPLIDTSNTTNVNTRSLSQPQTQSQQQQYHLTPHQILQLNQRSNALDTLDSFLEAQAHFHNHLASANLLTTRLKLSGLTIENFDDISPKEYNDTTSVRNRLNGHHKQQNSSHYPIALLTKNDQLQHLKSVYTRLLHDHLLPLALLKRTLDRELNRIREL